MFGETLGNKFEAVRNPGVHDNVIVMVKMIIRKIGTEDF
jgi:hypothetical protein